MATASPGLPRRTRSVLVADRSDDEPRSRCAPRARPAGGPDLIRTPSGPAKPNEEDYRAVSPTTSRYRPPARQTQMNGRSHRTASGGRYVHRRWRRPHRHHAGWAFGVQLARFRPAWASPRHTQTSWSSADGGHPRRIIGSTTTRRMDVERRWWLWLSKAKSIGTDCCSLRWRNSWSGPARWPTSWGRSEAKRSEQCPSLSRQP